jgi:transposase
MSKEVSAGKPTTRRYSEAEKERAVRMVRQLRRELGYDSGTIGRVAKQLGIGTESLPGWFKQAEIDDGIKPGMASVDATRINELEQEDRELRRANEILRRASAFSRRSSTAHRDNRRVHRRQPPRSGGRAHLHRAAGGSVDVLRQAPSAVGARPAGRGDDAGAAGAVAR